MARFLWVFLLLVSHSLSATNLVIDNDFKRLDFSFPLATAIDTQASSAKQILQTSRFDTGLYKESISPNTHSYWYKIELAASELGQFKHLVLVSQSHLLQHFDIYLFKGDTLLKSKALGLKDRPASEELYQGVVFKFSVAPYERLTLLIHKETDGPGIMPLSLMDDKSFAEDQVKILMLWGGAIGIFIALAVYNGVVFSLNRNSAQYGWYLLFQLFMFLNFAPLHGFGYLLFPDPFVRWLGSHMGTLHLLMLWCALMFGQHFLDIKKYRPKVGLVIEKSVWVFVPLLVINLLMSEFQRMILTSVLIIIVSFICISSAVIAARKKYTPALFYLLSWVCTFIGATTGFLTYSNVVPQNLITLHSFMLGVLAELYLLSVALAKRLQYQEQQDEQHRLIDQTLNMPNQIFYQYALQKQFYERNIDTSRVRLILISMEGLDHLTSILGADKVALEIRRIMSRIARPISKLHWHIGLHLDKRYFGVSIPPHQTLIFVNDDVSTEQQVETLFNIWQQQLTDSIYFSDIHLRAASVSDGEEINQLHQKAYMALLEAEKKGLKWLPYDNKMMEKIETHAQILHELRLAIDARELDMYIQPKVNVATNRVMSGEALMRWHHATMGMIPPSVFIPLAEQSGLIHSLTRIAIEKMFAWLADSRADMSLSINISAIDLEQLDFIDYLKQTSSKYSINTSQITLEITESQELDKSKELVTKIAAIKSLGFAISLDDFGTGYSSMAYLSQLDIDEVKVDMIFVKNIQNNSTNQAIVKTLISMAETLGAQVVIEGIETSEELEVIRRLGGSIGQGYFWSPAIAAHDFEQQYMRPDTISEDALEHQA